MQAKTAIDPQLELENQITGHGDKEN